MRDLNRSVRVEQTLLDSLPESDHESIKLTMENNATMPPTAMSSVKSLINELWRKADAHHRNISLSNKVETPRSDADSRALLKRSVLNQVMWRVMPSEAFAANVYWRSLNAAVGHQAGLYQAF